MKIHVDIDCSPEEARTFLGLPDVTALQTAMMRELEERMRANLKGMDAETLMKTWMPAGMAGLEQMQKMFWQQFAQGAKPGSSEPRK